MPHKCPAARAEYRRAYKAKNRALLAAKQREYARARPEVAKARIDRMTPEQYAHHRALKNAANRRWKERNRDTVRAKERVRSKSRVRESTTAERRRWHAKSRYGLTVEAREKMLAEQNGLCAICRGPQVVRDELYVDHDHATGAVRGLLCHHCNAALGHVRESTETLHRMTLYLNVHRTLAVA